MLTLFSQTFSTLGSILRGINVNGDDFNGGAYNATPVNAQNTGVTVTKVLDLQTGDTVCTVLSDSAADEAFGTANCQPFHHDMACPDQRISRRNMDTT